MRHRAESERSKNEIRDCDRTVISQAGNLEEHRGLRTHIT